MLEKQENSDGLLNKKVTCPACKGEGEELLSYGDHAASCDASCDDECPVEYHDSRSCDFCKEKGTVTLRKVINSKQFDNFEVLKLIREVRNGEV